MHATEFTSAALLLLLLLLGSGASGARILALMVVPSHSHHLWNSRYLEALARRGHHITYFSADEYLDPPRNITNILVRGAYDQYDDIDFSEVSNHGPYQNLVFLHRWIEQESDFIVRNEGFEKLRELARKEKFDLVVHDFASSWFLLGVVDVLGRPPVIAITAFGIPSLALTVLGNPLSCSSQPHHLSHYPDTMSLLQRADNFFLNLWTLAVEWFFLRKEDERARTSFGPNVRPLDQILDDINIVIVNANPATDFPFPKVPGLIPVGGLHIREPKPLPQDLKTFLDEAEDGVVYFSLGSNVKSSKLPKGKVDILKEAFREISPVRVLWKWESDSLAGKPSNVKTGKWLPQNDILAHPNVRLFFTHSGLLSTQEALYHGKPIVGMPFFLDQHVNVEKCVERRLGERLHVESLTVKDVVETIKKVLGDPRYAENARKASAVFRDDSEKPLDRAVYWTEYAIRHEGARHLRHSARDLSWYQNWMLDVLALTLGVVALASFCAYKVAAAVATGAAAGSRRRDGKKRE